MRGLFLIETASDDCAALSFHGVDFRPTAVAELYEVVVRWFEEVGSPPDLVSAEGPGLSGNWTKFAPTHAKLLKRGFEGIKDLSLVSMVPDGRIPVDDYLVSVIYSAKYSNVSLAARSSLAPLSQSAMLPIARQIAHFMKPQYGIGYTRSHRKGPMMYAVGICQGLGPDGYGVGLIGAEREEADSISWWGDGMSERVWEKGILRDVYPWCFLTEPQLRKSVNGVPLEDWVRRGKRRGTLNSLCEGVSLWEVDESDIPIVRALLRDEDVLFDWRKHVTS
jgi:hypothetical protein